MSGKKLIWANWTSFQISGLTHKVINWSEICFPNWWFDFVCSFSNVVTSFIIFLYNAGKSATDQSSLLYTGIHLFTAICSVWHLCNSSFAQLANICLIKSQKILVKWERVNDAISGNYKSYSPCLKRGWGYDLFLMGAWNDISLAMRTRSYIAAIWFIELLISVDDILRHVSCPLMFRYWFIAYRTADRSHT